MEGCRTWGKWNLSRDYPEVLEYRYGGRIYRVKLSQLDSDRSRRWWLNHIREKGMDTYGFTQAVNTLLVEGKLDRTVMYAA